MTSFPLLEDSQNHKYDNFVYQHTHRLWNVLYRWRKFFSKNYHPPVIQAPILRIYDIVNGQQASVVASAGFYMDVGVDLNAKYSIMCRKTVLIPYLFTYNSDIFSGMSETMMHQSFNICNPIPVSLNFFTILPITCVVRRLYKP